MKIDGCAFFLILRKFVTVQKHEQLLAIIPKQNHLSQQFQQFFF